MKVGKSKCKRVHRSSRLAATDDISYQSVFLCKLTKEENIFKCCRNTSNCTKSLTKLKQ